MYNTPDLFAEQDLFCHYFSVLNASSKRDLCRYLKYLLLQQRHEEVLQVVFQDAQLISLLNEFHLNANRPEILSKQSSAA